MPRIIADESQLVEQESLFELAKSEQYHPPRMAEEYDGEQYLSNTAISERDGFKKSPDGVWVCETIAQSWLDTAIVLWRRSQAAYNICERFNRGEIDAKTASMAIQKTLRSPLI